MIKDFGLKWLRWKMPDVIAAGFPQQRLSRPFRAKWGALGDAALIRWHGEGFSSLASWLVLKIALVAPLSRAYPDTFHTVKPLENPSRCILQSCVLVLYTMSLWLCTRLHTNRMQQTPPRKLILSRSKTEYVPCSSIYMIMQPMPYMALSTLFLIWYQSALRSANW